MTSLIRAAFPALLVVAALLGAPAPARAAAVVTDAPYPGTLTLQVDATDLDRRIFRVRETVPVRPGPLTLYYPRWIPGTHAPIGRVSQLAGLTLSAAGVPVAWRRDPLDVHAFALDGPAGVTTLNIEFQHLSPVNREEPNSFTKGFAAQRKFEDFSYSLGFDVAKGDMLGKVRWGSPAFNAGLSTAVQLIAVDGRAYEAERLKAVITASKTGRAPIQLLVKDGDLYKTVAIAYSGGLRYPKLERIEGSEDRLTQVLAPRP